MFTKSNPPAKPIAYRILFINFSDISIPEIH